jgi:uncharacterized protein
MIFELWQGSCTNACPSGGLPDSFRLGYHGKINVRENKMSNSIWPVAAIPYPGKWEVLKSRFCELGRVMVAYSGGIDSTLLLKAGTTAIGVECIGVIARSETLTDDEFNLALEVARAHDFNVRTIEYSELEIDHYSGNPTNRCYFCKHELYSRLTDLAKEIGVRYIAEGTHAGDTGDWRPGLKAVAELDIISPLRDAGLDKQEIRSIAEAVDLPNWDKPSNPCLSSRIAYGLEIDREKLDQVAMGEKWLRERGFRQVRVRHHDEYARVEVGRDELVRVQDPEMQGDINAYLVGLGFKRVEIDPRGYRTGSLNEAFFNRDEG